MLKSILCIRPDVLPPSVWCFFFKRASLQLTDGGSVTSRDEGYIPFSQAEKTGIAALYDALPTVTTTGIRCALAGFCARNHHRAALRAGSSATGWLAEEGPAGRGEGEQSSPGKERKWEGGKERLRIVVASTGAPSARPSDLGRAPSLFYLPIWAKHRIKYWFQFPYPSSTQLEKKIIKGTQ
jgi:hypothetical protein